MSIRGKSVEELEELNARGLVRRRDIPEYEVWGTMKQRCNNPNNRQYKDYGGRGIIVFELWQHDFWAWFRHIGRCPEGNYYQDRIDNNGSYVPGNLHWVTPKVSAYNRRKNKFTKLTPEDVEQIRAARGGVLSQRQLAEIFGVSRSNISVVQLGKEHNSDGAFERPSKITGVQGGERNPNATLSNAQVADIKGLRLKGHTGPVIAQRFGVHRDVISRIDRGERGHDIQPNLSAVLPPFPHGGTLTRRSLIGDAK